MAAALRTLLTNGSFVLLVACFTLPALAGWVVKDWMPALLKNMFNISQGQAGAFAATALVSVLLVQLITPRPESTAAPA